MSEETCVNHKYLRDLSTRIQMGFGIPQEHAATVSDCLVEANLMGLDTHGVLRLKFYMERVKLGGNNPKSNISTIKDKKCTALLDADNALGPVGGKAAMDLAIKKAGDSGLGMVLIRNCNHYGPAGYYARMPLAHDMIGISLTNVLASMPPTGSAEVQVGNNAYSLGFPTGKEYPVVVDGATSKSSWGKLYLCAQKGEDLPKGCYLDSQGNVTLDPQAVLQGGALLPIAGHKGYGIAVAIELLTGMLAEATLDHDIPHPFKYLDQPGLNTFAMGAIKIDCFTEVAGFKKRMDEWIRLIRNSRRISGVEKIWLPGEMEAVTRENRLANGIPLNANMISELKDLAREANTPFTELNGHQT